MTLQDLQTLVDYHYWARDRLLAALEPLTPEQVQPRSGQQLSLVRETVTHVYAAEWAWYERWKGPVADGAAAGDRFADLAALRAAWTDQERNLRAYIDRLGDGGVSRIIEYKLLSGQAGASPIWQMVQHVVNHASYHRGQITTMLRQIGAEPPKPMDLIAYYRVQAARS